MKRYGIIALPIFLFGAIVLTLNLLNPQTAGPAGILFVFTLIYLLFLSLFTLILYFGGSVLKRVDALSMKEGLNPQKSYYMASVLACFPVFLLAIMTIGELRAADILLVGLFVFLASFYVARRT